MFGLEIKLYENERIDDLQCKGLKIIQKKDGFCFGLDAVLLANFADIKKGDAVIDLGTGTGIISILIAGKTEAKSVTGLEIQEEMAEMAQRSVELNNIGDRVKIVCGDIKNSVEMFGASKFNVVVTNPPYMNQGGGLLNISDTKAISRHEIKCTLEDVIKASSKLLVPGGQFAMVHRPDRLVDIVWLMRKYSIEPKYLQFVHPAPHKKANLLLIKGARQGGVQLKMMEPLYVYDENGNYSKEIDNIYGREVRNIE
ncbi:MAG TPA: tRNA1(Val) (adenine(37)-N6)-methyltransferase [Acetivibrio sp.]|uniref:tRNA1(Val) (adenine(37)-N6)-methyltransferase n=1 Tax=Acetivibrio sp. TaxID=1872092 RepID=UPI002C81B274|nr:tRNA1(Val) (adenine(37)-N6)-methyltransferase [Acetivibrio sp.]HOM02508.1 tRNA1(Val) (adenine(37)-N6)-methyltransferase [Acetivibrio sp.]